ncbi:MAG: hypothetical protein RLY16_381 [Bacteroidota bacterium]|jgi:thiol:disulfide interchange protein DsbD
MSLLKNIAGFFLLFFSVLQLQAQEVKPVNWQVSSHKIAEKQYEIQWKASIEKGWHIYARNNVAEGIDGLKIIWADSSFQIKEPVLSANFKTIADPVFDGHSLEIVSDSIVVKQIIRFADNVPDSLRVQLNYFAADAGNLLPEELKFKVGFEGGAVSSAKARLLIPSIDLKHPIADCEGATTVVATAHQSLWKLVALGFFAGLIALLTPCVFPMIPLTVSFFTKKSSNRKTGIRNAMLYGVFILAIYVVLSLPFHFLDKLDPEILNNISTNVYLNVAFFVIFIVFAVSFFGYFEITLPGSLSNATDNKASTTNIIGIFFMALTLALVSFSCTGPILGSLLAGSLSSDGGAMQLTAGMAGFGFALALPFALFALFPNMLKSLPKSGGWLNTVKVVLGFLEVGLALKFLSNADLVMHWGLLKREVFIGLWIVIGALTTLYLLGFIRFPHDSPLKERSPLRWLFIALFGLFTLYLLPGVTRTKYANLTLISGFPPPLYYSIYDSGECILGLNCTRDYETGLKMAKALNKPMLLDFTGYGCVNCRRMEEKVWSQPDVLEVMRSQFVVVSLYVDDKAKLPANQRFTYLTKAGAEKDIVTVGDKWATFETENFENNAQPLYAIVSPNEVLLNRPVGNTPVAADYLKWLQCGLAAFKQVSK